MPQTCEYCELCIHPIDRASVGCAALKPRRSREALGEHLGIGARRVRRRRRSDQVKPAPVHRRPRKDRHTCPHCDE